MSMEPREHMRTMAEEYANQIIPAGCQCTEDDDEICEWCAEVEEYFIDRFHRRYLPTGGR
jgi:hypothetical protein